MGSNVTDPAGFSPMAPSKDIVCKTCKHKLPPIKIAGTEIEGYTKGECAKFKYAPATSLSDVKSGKPYGVLFKGEACDFYEKE